MALPVETSIRVSSLERPLVMIVDDEVSICSTLSSVLEDESFATITANSGSEALEKIREFNPVLVFLDIWMPGWDGLETLEKIKAASPLTEVVVISGHATIANALEATRRGAFDFIEKPFDIDSIVISANRALEHYKQQVEINIKSSLANHSLGVANGYGKVDLPVLTHPGILSTGLKGANIGQRTLKASAVLYGQGLHSGEKSGLILEPLPLNSGIHFGKIGGAKSVAAFLDNVESTSFATTIRRDSVSAATIEHLMAALHAYKISNLLIKCNREVPILDGSASKFCQMIDEVGIEEQGGVWNEIAIDRKIVLGGAESGRSLGEFISIEPSASFVVNYELAYPEPVGKQEFSFTLSSAEAFKREIASARTFGFVKDIEKLQRAGLAAGGRFDNFIMIGPDNVVNTELRFDNEPARHKILDIIGDLFLLGRPIRGTVTARMSGHSDNTSLLCELKKLACPVMDSN
ncbi:MAG: UDP-3-O-[3-hydroxymyristoyl] N-acetylglucosamine deacetylase [Deltaproteobacteria bacterium]|nr:UDP-3-O-[3-hydroxymyristoyl] N-acetylglucosamine deacetylase [Deltaproteobacteria bacterium]